MKFTNHPSSFRDPAGSLIYLKDTLHRTINNIYKEDYDYLMKSGLYEKLVTNSLIVSHKEVVGVLDKGRGVYKIIKPEVVPFVSYPYEWTFEQLKQAALLTVKIQKTALHYNMILKDASAFNVQFVGYRPIFIDTLSLRKYREGDLWDGYRQFCQHFLAPLLLVSKKDFRLNQMSKIFLDGVPLDLAVNLLPKTSVISPSTFLHLLLHSKSQSAFQSIDLKKRSISKTGLMAILNNLEHTISNLEFKSGSSEWGRYYENTVYPDKGFEQKVKIVKKFLFIAKGSLIWDLGANTGLFSRLADKPYVVSMDWDMAAVEKNFHETCRKKEENILALYVDITNPSPSLGWAGKERLSLAERGPADVVLALALIHHITITNNVPFALSASYFRLIAKKLIIEFVGSNDPNVRKMGLRRKNALLNYSEELFVKEYSRCFRIASRKSIVGTSRSIYYMLRK